MAVSGRIRVGCMHAYPVLLDHKHGCIHKSCARQTVHEKGLFLIKTQDEIARVSGAFAIGGRWSCAIKLIK